MQLRVRRGWKPGYWSTTKARCVVYKQLKEIYVVNNEETHPEVSVSGQFCGTGAVSVACTSSMWTIQRLLENTRLRLVQNYKGALCLVVGLL